jgi:hypothetical protein
VAQPIEGFVVLVVKIVLAILVVLVLAAAVLRIRKLRRDEFRGQAVKIDKRLMTPPPSPYATSKGFRLLDGSAPQVSEHPQPSRPRLEPERDYVFSDAQLPPYEISNLARLRHDESWALSRSARRAHFSVAGLRMIALAVLVIAVAVVAIVLIGHHAKGHGVTTSTSTSTTTSTTSSTTTTTPPTSSGLRAPTNGDGSNARSSFASTVYVSTPSPARTVTVSFSRD